MSEDHVTAVLLLPLALMLLLLLTMYGTGSGFLVACFAKLVLPGGYVLGLEKVPELVSSGIHICSVKK